MYLDLDSWIDYRVGLDGFIGAFRLLYSIILSCLRVFKAVVLIWRVGRWKKVGMDVGGKENLRLV